MTLKFSVITPSYNQGMYLEETIDSVLSQNYPNLEYIIIDGGSSDNSIEIIKKYQRHLKFWMSEKDRGHWDALNKGFSHATGDILSWINSDDRYFAWTFRSVNDIFTQNEDVQWLTGLSTTIDEQSRITSAVKVRKDAKDFILGNYHWIQQESTFWRKDLWALSGGKITSDYKLMVDGDLWARFFKLTRLWHVDLTLGAYRIHGINRALVQKDEVEEEMNIIVHRLKKDLGIACYSAAHLRRFARKAQRLLRLFRVNHNSLDFEFYPTIIRHLDSWVANDKGH